MADILNFNPDRKLSFDSGRALGFDSSRGLQFDPGRTLEFHPERDLGFGRRGVVFRGFVCPICGALVTEDAPSCAECGAVFEGPPRAPGPQVPESSGPAAARKPKESARPPAPPDRAERRAGTTGKFCAFCGAKLSPADTFCWNCGARSFGTTETVRLPSSNTTPVTRDWRGPDER